MSLPRRLDLSSIKLIALAGLLTLAVGFAARPGQQTQVSSAPAQQASPFARFAFGGNVSQIPAEFIGYLVFLPVHVNHTQPSLFELDSSAAASSMDPSRATELGISDLRVPVLSFSGVDVLLSSLTKTEKKDFGAQVGRHYEGTLGGDFFSNVVIEIDSARKTVQFYDPSIYRYTGRGKSVPLTFAGGVPIVHAKFNPMEGKSAEGNFAVNTALDASVLISDSSVDFQRAFHRKTIPAGLQLTDQENDELQRSKSLQIGPYTMEAPIAELSQRNISVDADTRIVGEIGAGMLRHFTVIFDYPHRQMILEPNSDFRTVELEDMSGIFLVAKGPDLKTFEVAQVRPGTPAADAEIHQGDVIAGVNEEPAADLSLADIRELFHHDDHPYSLLIERNGRTFSVIIRMRKQL